MTRKFLILNSSLLILSCVGCIDAAKKTTEVETKESTYVMPAIPGLISEPEQQAEWAARHFWDNLDFADTANVYRPQYVEQAFVDYVQLLRNIPRPLGDESLKILFERAAVNKDMFVQVSEVAEKYLFDPNSPMRDDEYYITALNLVLANPALDQWERIRPQEQLGMSLRNRVGTRAADFRYTMASGKTGTLYGIKAPYTLLFINNPGCPACLETQMQIMNSAFLMRLIAEGTIAVLAIYPDEDLAAWRDHAPHIPAEWINSYDKELAMRERELYDLKAIPTLYLLDRNKTVLLKDVMSIPEIENTIYGTN